MFDSVPENKRMMVYASIAIIVCAVALNIFLIFFNPFNQSSNSDAVTTEAPTIETSTSEAATSEAPAAQQTPETSSESAQSAEQAPRAALTENEATDFGNEASTFDATTYSEEVNEPRVIEASDIVAPDNLPNGISVSDFQEAIANALDSKSGTYTDIVLVNSGIDASGASWWRYGAENGNGYSCFAMVTYNGSTLSVSKE